MRQEGLLDASVSRAALKVGYGLLFLTDMMKRQPTHQGSLQALKLCISCGLTYLTASSIIVFTCGATPNDAEPRGRDTLMAYANKHLRKYNFFIAEHFFEAFQNMQGKDLLSLEDELARFCDCIIVVLESESAYSELGAFAIKDDLAKIMLIINDRKFIHSKSFISLVLCPIIKHAQLSPESGSAS